MIPVAMAEWIQRDLAKVGIRVKLETFDWITYLSKMFQGLRPGHGAYQLSWGMTTDTDRKSTRLNSSHDQISYAVFCLKKKKNPEGVLWGLPRARAARPRQRPCTRTIAAGTLARLDRPSSTPNMTSPGVSCQTEHLRTAATSASVSCTLSWCASTDAPVTTARCAIPCAARQVRAAPLSSCGVAWSLRSGPGHAIPFFFFLNYPPPPEISPFPPPAPLPI